MPGKQIPGALRSCGYWTEHRSTNSGRIYYYNYRQKVNTWYKPDEWDDERAVILKETKPMPPKPMSAAEMTAALNASINKNDKKTYSDRRQSFSNEQPPVKKPNLNQKIIPHSFQQPRDKAPNTTIDLTLPYKPHIDRTRHEDPRSINRQLMDKNSQPRRNSKNAFSNGQKHTGQNFRPNYNFNKKEGDNNLNLNNCSRQNSEKRKDDEPKIPRKTTLATICRDRMKEMIEENKNKWQHGNNCLKDFLNKFHYKYDESILSNIPNYPLDSIPQISEILSREQASYKIGTIFNSHTLPSLLKSKSKSRVLEIRELRQQLRLGAIGEQIAILNNLVNDNNDTLKAEVLDPDPLI